MFITIIVLVYCIRQAISSLLDMHHHLVHNSISVLDISFACTFGSRISPYSIIGESRRECHGDELVVCRKFLGSDYVHDMFDV